MAERSHPKVSKAKAKSRGTKPAPKPAKAKAAKAAPKATKPARKPVKVLPPSKRPSLAKTTPRPSREPAKIEPTLEVLARRLGALDGDLREAIFDGIEASSLVEIGTRIDTADILREVPRFVAAASEIERSLTTAQRECLFFSPSILAVLVGEALHLRGMLAAPAAPPDPAGGAVRAEVREGLALRNNVLAALRNALGAAAMARVEELVGSAETAARLASGMEQLGTFIDELLKVGDRHEHLRLRAFHLTPGRAQVLRDFAGKLRALDERPAPLDAPAWAAEAQRKLDRQDGRVIELMERVLRAFQAAHRQDRSIRVPELHALDWVFEPQGGGQ